MLGLNHYRHHLGDYAKDTMHLAPLEHGVYRLLIDAYYATEKPLPLDFDSVCRIARAVSRVERDAVKRVRSDFFTEAADGWHHKRIDAEIAAFHARSEINRAAGLQGGRPPKEKRTESETVNECETITKHSESLASSHKPTSPSLRSGEGRRKRAARTPIPEGFGLSVRVIDWAKAKGYEHLQDHLDAFRLKAAANDYRYVDWDAALMNAIEADWAGIRRNGARLEKRGADAFEDAKRLIAEKEATHAAA